MQVYLDFEKNIADLEDKIRELRHMSNSGDVSIASEIEDLQKKADKMISSTYSKLDSWQRVKVARHPERPHLMDYIAHMTTDFTALAGDRKFGEDKAMICGICRFNGRSVAIIGQEKGFDTQTRIEHNFGSARPEGYRKAARIMKLAEKFSLPVISLIDTAGAYPGIGAEERGQAEAIARGTQVCLDIETPFISIIIGEGGSGGAIAICAADRVYMLENSIYSVISPEGCASILWRSPEYAKDAAKSLKLTAKDVLELGVIDGIISEPLGGAHRDKKTAISNVASTIATALKELDGIGKQNLVNLRAEKYLKIGS